MSIARRDAKWNSACVRCAAQVSSPVQRATASPSSRTMSEPQIGQCVGIFHGFVFAGRVLDHDAHDFRNHVAGATHDHGIADAHVEPRDLVGVVQRRIRHGDAADLHRREARGRRRRARAADVDFDRLDGRLLFLRRELVRDRPARRAADETHLALVGVVVELVDDAVDVERQLVALLADARVVGEAAVRAFRRVDQRTDRQAPFLERGQRLRMRRRQRAAFDDAERIRIERERTFRGLGRVLHAHAAGRAVARIDQHLAAALARLGVVFLERGARHVDLAAHFEHARPAFCRCRRSGIALIVRRFAVTSSPVSPSPRVAPRTSTPFS